MIRSDHFRGHDTVICITDSAVIQTCHVAEYEKVSDELQALIALGDDVGERKLQKLLTGNP